MHLDVRPVSRLRGADRVNVMALLAPVVDTLCDDAIDLSRISVVCDWVQYRANFREVADFRPVLSTGWPGCADPEGEQCNGADGPGRPAEAALEIALDLRRCADADLPAVIGQLLREHADPATSSRMPLEPWVAMARSCIWRFNALYWQALSFWEQATGREYEQALPGGESDARNTAAVRELILELFKVWDDLDTRGALPAELYVVELGVGNGNQAKTWLDEFVTLPAAHGRDYYRRLQHLMGDYSPHVLGRALKAVVHHSDHVTALVVDATHPAVSLGFLRGKAFLAYVSNVYDNLPSDELVRIGGRTYRVEVRAYLPGADVQHIAAGISAPPDRLPDIVSKLLRLGPELLCEAMPQHFDSAERAVVFWREVWAALDSTGDIRMHVNNGALSSFAETLPLLRPFGRLQCHDLFLTDIRQYRAGFFGPGKYDGSVVNWINSPLLHRVGSRSGFDVQIASFAGRPSSNIKTLTAQVRE
jgi:hypothetical protein